MQVNRRNIIILIVFNSIILFELCFSLAQASKNPENVVLVFLKYLFFLIIPTFIIGRFVIKKFLIQEERAVSNITTYSNLKEEEKALYSQLTEKEETYTEPLQIPKSVKEISKKKKFLEKLSILFIFMLIISFFDGCVNKLLHPPNILNLLPGQSVLVNAPLEKKVDGVHELTYTATSENIKLEFKEIYSGFWLGGTEWRGVLTVNPHTKPGEYQVIIQIKDFESKRPFIFFVKVYQNIEELRKSSMSLIKKTLGISPWIFFIISFLLFLITIFSILMFSNKIEAVMSANGQAEVFFIKKRDLVTEIGFGLGTKNNLKSGDVLSLYTDKGYPVGNVIVLHTMEEYSIGIVKSEHNVKPGFIVASKK